MVISEELKSPSADLPWILDLIYPPTTSSAETNFFFECIMQLDDLLASNEGTSVPLPPKLVASLPSNEALLSTIITPIGQVNWSPKRSRSNRANSSVIESPSSSFSDTTKFVVATVLDIPWNFESRMHRALIGSLLHLVEIQPSVGVSIGHTRNYPPKRWRKD